MRPSSFAKILTMFWVFGCGVFTFPFFRGVESRVTAFNSYGIVFPPVDPSTVPVLDRNNSTVLTVCVLWENDSIPVTPGIEVALRRIRPHFAFRNITFEILRQTIPAGCGDDTVLAAAPALVNLHLNRSKHGCSLLIGPSCTESMYNVRGLAMHWNIPVVTSGASGIKFEDKNRTKVLTRFGYTQEDVSLLVIRVLDKFHWSNIVMIYDVDSYARDFQNSFQQVLQTYRTDLYQKIDMLQMLSSLLPDSKGSESWMDDILIKASERARVIIISAMPPVVYRVMQVAKRLGMLTPEYAYITTNLIEAKSHGFSDLSFFDEKAKSDPGAREILDSLLVLRMKTPADDPSGRDEYDEFANTVKAMSRESFNYTYAPADPVTHLVLGIWDATMFYGIALNNSLLMGEDIYNGRQLTSHIWGHSFMGVVIECTISVYGDRNFPYYVLDLDPETKVFQPVIFMDNEQLKLVDLKPIHWPGGGSNPPNNVPRCGFNGRSVECADSGIPVYGIILIVIFVGLLLLIGAGFGFYRLKMSRMNIDSWKVRAADIIPRCSAFTTRFVPLAENGRISQKIHAQRLLLKIYESERERKGGGSSSLKTGMQKIDELRTNASSLKADSRASAFSYIATAYYKESVVAVKKLEVGSVHLTPQLLYELRTLKDLVHDHLARFIGLCPEPGTICILMEHCAKGSLTDLIENESINLDWPFKFSLLNDLVDGLLFVHASDLESHGRITSNNCLVDGRFIMKVGDLGLASLRPSFVVASNKIPPSIFVTDGALRSLLYKAPELLRASMPANGTQKGDIYSFAIVVQQVILRCGPYERSDSEYGAIDVKAPGVPSDQPGYATGTSRADFKVSYWRTTSPKSRNVCARFSAISTDSSRGLVCAVAGNDYLNTASTFLNNLSEMRSGEGCCRNYEVHGHIVERVRDVTVPPYRPRVIFDSCPPELYSIMSKCWSELPADRYDAVRLRTALKQVPGNKSGNLMDDLLQRMERYAKDLETLVNERTAAFMDEKKRSEELLYQMLPKAVANKLKQGLFVEPETFDMCSIYFSDIVGFTTLSATSTPMEVVDLLNDLYTLFDGIIEAYDVYKVETIGDAYVVVSGLPQRIEKRHACEIARMSLHVIAAIRVFKIRHKPQEKLTLRVGVHSGPCAAGVVGLKMPRYCIFGDSVNIASRLESTSQAMKIHVSLTTKVFLDEYKEFIMEHRGEVDLKGRGTMTTYWLHSAAE